MTRIALTAALILATVTGCATDLPLGAKVRLAAKPPSAKAAVKAAAKAVGLRPAPILKVFKGPEAAAVTADEQAAATVDADVDTTLTAFEAFADEDGGYQLQGLGALGVSLKTRLKARLVTWGVLRAEVQRKVLTRRAVRAKVLKAKLAHREDVRKAFKAVPWVDNGDGTKTKSVDYTMDVAANGKTFSRHVAGTITINAETKALILATGELSQQLPSGATLTASSEKALQADGSYLAKRQSVTTLAGGTSRTAEATRTIDTDGGVTGTGTITWKNAAGEVISTKTWTFAGNEDAETPEAVEAEPVTGDEAEVEAPAEATAEI